ncbi:MAG: hypothetical protein JST82_13780 [Bacteroidetes bacterium]|nr:hypothetical protein [Bacteroidota bacterium]
MKEPSKNKLLVPLGIGAGVLLLLASTKNKASAAQSSPASPSSPQLNTSGDDAMPQPDEPTAAGQIVPSPAPPYKPSNVRSAQPIPGGNNDDTDERQQDDTGGDGQGEEQDVREKNNDDTSADVRNDDDSTNDDGSDYTIPDEDASSFLRYQPKLALPTGKNQRFAPGSKRMPTSQATGKRSVNYRPGTYNPKQARFDNQSYTSVSHRPGASNASRKSAVQNEPVPGNTNSTVKNRMLQSLPNQAGKIFPLRMGMNNAYVKEIQRRIGVPATGYFGTMTLTALRKRYNVSDVSEALYKQIITGKVIVAQKQAAKKPMQQKRRPHKPSHSKHGKKVLPQQRPNA